MKITYSLAMAAARDAGDRQAKENKRKTWSREDYNLACCTFAKLYPISEISEKERT